jgi:exodeoxyribonuclease-5
MQLSLKQMEVYNKIIDWIEDGYDQVFTVSGYAGTGKTTIIKYLAENLAISTACATYTGKAAHVIRQKIDTNINYIGTIHGLIYLYPNKMKIERLQSFKSLPKKGNSDTLYVIGDQKFRWTEREYIELPENFSSLSWVLRDYLKSDPALVIIDEGSMVDHELWTHLRGFNIPILVFGDHAQLPPIIQTDHNLMKYPDVFLEEIHRQALNNPIIQMSIKVRENHSLEDLDYIEYHPDLFKNHQLIDPKVQILCHKNTTRVMINEIIRNHMGYNPKIPQPGEKLICLQNNKKFGVFNGQIMIFKEFLGISKNHINCLLEVDNGWLNAPIYKPSLNRVKKPFDEYITDCILADYGYVTTVHKGQGSEWTEVVLIDEYSFEKDYRKWLYTGITRAISKIHLVEKNDYFY